jgi:hypothetical protein
MTTTTERFRPRLRPLSVGEILDVAIKICIAHWRTLVQTVLIVVVPVQIISTLLTADYTVSSLDIGTTNTQTAEETLDELNQYLGGLVLGTLLQVLAVLLASAACFRAIAQSYLGEDADWRSSLSYAVRRAPSLLWLTVLYGLGVLVGFIFVIAPGVWLYIAWAFATPILLTEGIKGRRALGRSYGLVKGRWWRTFGVIALGFILASIVSSVVQALFFAGILFNADNDALVLVLSAIAGIVGLLITTPLQAALLTVVYFDLRVRKEGFDLELLAQGIGGTAPAEPDELWPPKPQEWTRDEESPWRAGPAPEPGRAGDDAPAPAEPSTDSDHSWPRAQPAGGSDPFGRPAQPSAEPDPSPQQRAADDDDEPPRLPGVPSG